MDHGFTSYRYQISDDVSKCHVVRIYNNALM